MQFPRVGVHRARCQSLSSGPQRSDRNARERRRQPHRQGTGAARSLGRLARILAAATLRRGSRRGTGSIRADEHGSPPCLGPRNPHSPTPPNPGRAGPWRQDRPIRRYSSPFASGSRRRGRNLLRPVRPPSGGHSPYLARRARDRSFPCASRILTIRSLRGG